MAKDHGIVMLSFPPQSSQNWKEMAMRTQVGATTDQHMQQQIIGETAR